MALSKEQINQEISSLESSNSQLREKKDGYNQALQSANKMIEYLNDSKNHLSVAQDNLKNYFTINNKSADNGKIDDINDQIDLIIKNINNSVIPNLNQCISDADQAIANANNKISNYRDQYNSIKDEEE